MTQLKESGHFLGSAVDLRDGYIHFSTRDQVEETARRHFSSQSGLRLVAVKTKHLGPFLRYEASRDGALFPHLYGPLSFADVVWDRPIAIEVTGKFILPSFDPDQ
ncbi:MAG: dihydroorotate dehydrogenase [Rhizobiales bacterium PAR1]|nr:MAG: dihydroorotate dehydrogenase [Rhizobiales bacterium PAR1]